MEGAELNDHQPQENVSQETVTALLESAMSAGSDQLAAEYQIRQVDGGGPGGQILDCKVERDEQTGLPRVEMIFSISPNQENPQFTLLQDDVIIPVAHDVAIAVTSELRTHPRWVDVDVTSWLASCRHPDVVCYWAGAGVASDDISTSSTTEPIASQADLRTTNPPDTLFRSGATPGSGARVTTTPPPSGLQQNDVSSSSSGRRIDATDEQLLGAWKKWMERRSGLKRAILFASQVLDWHDERDPIIIIGFVTILYVLTKCSTKFLLPFQFVANEMFITQRVKRNEGITRCWSAHDALMVFNMCGSIQWRIQAFGKDRRNSKRRKDLVRAMSSSVLTSVGLIGFILCLLELIRLRPGVEDYINSIANISEDEERQLNSKYEQLLSAKRRLLDTARETIQLRNDRPVAFLLVMISVFFLLLIIGQYVNAITLLYAAGLGAALVPGILKRDILGKIGLRQLIGDAKKIK